VTTLVRPYGDTTGDGMVQVSFTLPVPSDPRAEGAALQLAEKMGLDRAMVVHARAIGADFTFSGKPTGTGGTLSTSRVPGPR
jgi:beta-lysine 5,6-aminomutase beta subunit